MLFKSLHLDVEVTPVGCMGLDFIDPWIELTKKGYPSAIYANVTPDMVEQIIREYLDRDFSSAYAFRFGNTDKKTVPLLDELDVWKNQVRWISGKCGIINPESIDEYMAVGGYQGLKKCLNLTQEETIEELEESQPQRQRRRRFSNMDKMEHLQRTARRHKIRNRKL